MNSYACWNYLINGPVPTADTIGINGLFVQGSLVGSGALTCAGARPEPWSTPRT
jgi:hypothetical protein